MRLLKKAQLPWHRSKKALQLKAQRMMVATGDGAAKKKIVGGKAKKKIVGAGDDVPAGSGGKAKENIVLPDVPAAPQDVPAGAGDDVAEFHEEPEDVFAPEVELHDEDSSSFDTEISDGLDEKHTEDSGTRR